LIRAIKPGTGFVLLGYAHLKAIQAVRENDPRAVELGLLALAVEDLRLDWRDTLVTLSLLVHSARKLRVRPGPLVERAAAVANRQCGDLLRRFLQREREDQSIEAMGYQEGQDEDGFTYVPEEW
jgi:hypothetical protein